MIFEKNKGDVTVERILTKNKYYAPKVQIALTALLKMNEYCQQCDKEIAWLGFVTCDNDSLPIGKRTYTIYDTTLCKQKISAVTADLDEDGLQLLAEELIANNKANMLKDIRCWGHSHVKMSPTPSGTDEDTFAQFYDTCEYFIRIIANKEGLLRLDIVFNEEEVRFDNVDWTIWLPDTLFQLQKEYDTILSKLNEKKDEINNIVKVTAETFAKDIEKEIKEKVKSNSTTVTSYTSYKNFASKIKVYTGPNSYIYQDIDEVLESVDIYAIADSLILDIRSAYDALEMFEHYTYHDWSDLKKAATNFVKEEDDYCNLGNSYSHYDLANHIIEKGN